MGFTGDAFFQMPDDEQREFIARRLRCDMTKPATWPYALIQELRDYRRQNGGPAFAEYVKQFQPPKAPAADT